MSTKKSWIEFTSAAGETLRRNEEREFTAETVELPLTTLRLIERIYGEFPEAARRILRARIFTTESPSRALNDLVKIGAKRISFPEGVQEAHSAQLTVDETKASRLLFPEEPYPHPEPRVNFEDLERFASQNSLGEKPRFEKDRPVACATFPSTGATTLLYRNQNQKVKTWHAEMLLLRANDYRLAEGTILFTTLKPCRMCAAWIRASIPSDALASVRVVYLHDDPGRFARNTELDVSGIQFSWADFKRENPEKAALFSRGGNARAPEGA